MTHRSAFPLGVVFALLLTLSACGGEAPSAEAEPEEPPGEHVWKDQTDTLDRARDVEQTLLDAEQRRRESIEEPDRD